MASPARLGHMELALAEARAAAARGEVPVGAVLVDPTGEVVAAAGNRTRELSDPSAHAEMLVIREAAARLGSERLTDHNLYVTLEPCPMCAGAILQARIPTVIFGALDPKAGAVQSLYKLLSDARLNHRCEIVPGVMAAECGEILTRFFAEKRRQGKK